MNTCFKWALWVCLMFRTRFNPIQRRKKRQLVRLRVNIQRIKRNMMKSSSNGQTWEIHNLKSIWTTAKGFCKVSLIEYNMTAEEDPWHELVGCRWVSMEFPKKKINKKWLNFSNWRVSHFFNPHTNRNIDSKNRFLKSKNEAQIGPFLSWMQLDDCRQDGDSRLTASS